MLQKQITDIVILVVAEIAMFCFCILAGKGIVALRKWGDGENDNTAYASAGFDWRRIDPVATIGFVGCLIYNVYHINRWYAWKTVEWNFLRVSMVADFIWIAFIVAHYIESDRSSSSYGTNKGLVRMSTLGILLIGMISCLAKFVCFEGSQFIANMRIKCDNDELMKVAEAIDYAYIDMMDEYDSIEACKDTYDKLYAGTDIATWGEPQNLFEQKIADRCDIDAIKSNICTAEGTPVIQAQIEDNMVTVRLLNPLEGAQRWIVPFKRIVEVPDILFIYHAYEPVKNVVDYYMCMDSQGRVYEILDNSIMENGFEGLTEAKKVSSSDSLVFISPTAGNSISEHYTMYKTKEIDIKELYDEYNSFIFDLDSNKLYIDSNSSKRSYFDMYDVEIFGALYDDDHNVIYEKIYYKSKDGYYNNKSRSEELVGSWLMDAFEPAYGKFVYE